MIVLNDRKSNFAVVAQQPLSKNTATVIFAHVWSNEFEIAADIDIHHPSGQVIKGELNAIWQ
jgi:hypothetical protein